MGLREDHRAWSGHGALAFISEQLPAFLDAALRVVTSLADGLIQALPVITEAETGFFIALVQGIL